MMVKLISGNIILSIFVLFSCPVFGDELMTTIDSLLSSTTATSNTLKYDPIEVMELFDVMANRTINDMVEMFERNNEIEKSRVKRASPYLVHDLMGTHKLKSITVYADICSDAQTLEWQYLKPYIVVVCSQADELLFHYGRVNSDGFELFHRVLLDSSKNHLASFIHGGSLFIVVGQETGTVIPQTLIYEVAKGDDEEFRPLTAHRHLSPGIDHPVVLATSMISIYSYEMLSGTVPFLFAANQTHIHVHHWVDSSKNFNPLNSPIKIDSVVVKDICGFTIDGIHYMVVVNYGQLATHMADTLIYKFHPEKSYQVATKITTYGAVDCEYFSIGDSRNRDHFLAIVNTYDPYSSNTNTSRETNSVLYKYSAGNFKPFQCINTRHGKKFVAYEGDSEEDGQKQPEFLLMLLESHGIRSFQYGGWRFVEIVKPQGSSLLNGRFSDMVVSKSKEFPMIAVAGISSPSHLYLLDFEHENDLHKWYRDSLGWCENTLKGINEENLNQLRKMMQNVYYIDQQQEIRIPGNLHFKELNVLKALSSPDVYVHGQNISSYAEALHRGSRDLSRGLDQLDKEIKNLEHLLGLAMKLNGDQSVSGTFTFEEAYFTCGNSSCNIGSIEANYMNGRDVANLTKKIIRLDRDEILTQYYNFSSIVVAKDLNVSSINGINPADIVTKNGDHEIDGNVEFSAPVSVNQLSVAGTINGKRFDRESVLTTNDDQEIFSPISFLSSVSVRNLTVAGHVTQLGTNMETFLNGIVQAGRSHTITGRKHFDTLKVGNMFVNNGTIGGVNMVDLAENLLTRNTDQVVTGSFNVSHLTIKGDAWVDRVNGQRFDESFVRRNVSTTVYGDKIFTAPLRIERMSVNGYLNGRQISDQDSLGLLLKTRNQTITGLKKFRNIIMNQGSKFNGRLGPLETRSLRTKLQRGVSGGKDRILQGSHKVKSIHVSGLVNGVNVSELFTNYVKVNQSSLLVKNLFISKAIFRKPLHCGSINGFKFPDHFLTKNTDQNITGTTIFSNDITVIKSLTLDRLNNYAVNAGLIDSLTRYGSQNITGQKEIFGDLHVKNLHVRTLNNIDMYDLVRLDTDENIYGNKTFNKLQVDGKSYVGAMKDLKTINDIPLASLLENSLFRNKFQIVVQPVRVKKLIIPEDANIHIDQINGIDLSNVIKSAVKLNSSKLQVIRGKKQFSAPVTFGNLKFNKTFAGFTPDGFLKDFFKRPNDRVIHGDVMFNSDLIIDGNLVVHGSLNRLNLSEIGKHIPINDKPIVINRPMIFDRVEIQGGNIQAREAINGIKFDQQIVTRNGKSTLTGNKVFLGGISVQHLTLNGTINNVSIESLCNSKQDFSRKSYSLTIIGDVSTEADVSSNGVNGVSFDERTSFSSSKPISGVKRFKKLVVKGPISLGGKLNNHSLQVINATYLSKTRSQVITSPVILKNVTFSGPVDIDGNLNGRNILINGVNLEAFASNTLQKTGDQYLNGSFKFPGKVIFKKGLYSSHGNIQLNRTVINLVRDAFLKRRSNEVTGNVHFEDAVMIGNMRTNSRSLFDRNLRSLSSITKSKVVYGMKNFTSLEVDDLIVKTINGIPVEKFLRSDIDATINAPISFKKGLEVRGNLTVRGTINSLKLEKLASDLVLKGANNTITANMTLTIKPSVRYIELAESLTKDPSGYLGDMFIPKKLKELQSKLTFEEGKVQDLSKFFQNQGQCFDYFELLTSVKPAKLLPFVSTSQDSRYFFLSEEGLTSCQKLLTGSISHNQYLVHPSLSVIVYRPVAAMTTLVNGVSFLAVLNENPYTTRYPEECIGRGYNSSREGNGRALLQVYRWDRKWNSYQLHQIKFIDNPSDADILSLGGSDCLAVAIPHSSNPWGPRSPLIFCFDNQGYLYERKLNASIGADKIATVVVSPSSAFIATFRTKSMNQPSPITLYKSYINGFVRETQTMIASSPTAIHLAHSHGKVYLFVAQGSNHGYAGNSVIRVFEYNVYSNSSLFTETKGIQDLTFTVTSISTTSLDDNSLTIFVMMVDSTLKIYKKMDQENIIFVKTITSHGSSLFAIVNGNNDDSYISNYLLLTKMSPEIDYGRDDETLILKSKMKSQIRGRIRN